MILIILSVENDENKLVVLNWIVDFMRDETFI